MIRARRRWRKRSDQSLQYASLTENGGTTRNTTTRRKPSRTVHRSTTLDGTSLAASRIPNPSQWRPSTQQSIFTPIGSEGRDDESLVYYSEDESKQMGFLPLKLLNGDDDADESDDEEGERVHYLASHYCDRHPRNRRQSPENTLPYPRHSRDRFSFLSLSPSSSSSLTGMKQSQSFETEETHPEEASQTSISTLTSLEDDAFSTTTKKVRWVDETANQDLAVVHSVPHHPAVTCRIVILLIMDHGRNPSENFEFLHCEYRLDQRLKVADALSQITELVAGTKEIPQEASDACIRDAAYSVKQSHRPFTSLYYQGRELINVCTLQDFPLEDGKSILVALRKSKDDRDLLLKQAALLLSDKRLNKEIKKARISGRSLQVLLSSQELSERKQVVQIPHFGAGDEDISIDSAQGVDSITSIWNLSLAGLKDADFGDSVFGSYADECHTECFDEEFFNMKGNDFFLHD